MLKREAQKKIYCNKLIMSHLTIFFSSYDFRQKGKQTSSALITNKSLKNKTKMNQSCCLAKLPSILEE